MSNDCFIIGVGKNASVDGSVLLGRSCDGDGDSVQQLLTVPRKKHVSGAKIPFEKSGIEIPQVSETYAYVSVMTMEEGVTVPQTQGGINEFQVSIGAAGGPLNPKAEAVCPNMPTSIGDYRMTLVLERCHTAREGIKLLGDLTEKYGARKDTYMVADPTEAWLYEEFRGCLWAAVRVPDDCFLVEANTLRIDHVDYNDSNNFMGAKNLVSFAVENDLYDPQSKIPFNPAKVYAQQKGKVKFDMPMPDYDTRRIWRSISLLAPSTHLDPEEPSQMYPLFVKPDWRLAPKDIIALFTDHYQGTEYDFYGVNKAKYRSVVSRDNMTTYPIRPVGKEFQINEKRQYQLAPEWGPERIIGTAKNMTNWCAQLRKWMPNSIGGLLWVALGEGATTGHIPIYSGITKTPVSYTLGINPGNDQGSEYDERSAYWTFKVLSNLVNLFYTATKDHVIPVWRKWEDQLYQIQPILEETAIKLYAKNPSLAINFITNYSYSRAIEALEMTKDMTKKLHKTIARYMGPR